MWYPHRAHAFLMLAIALLALAVKSKSGRYRGNENIIVLKEGHQDSGNGKILILAYNRLLLAYSKNKPNTVVFQRKGECGYIGRSAPSLFN